MYSYIQTMRSGTINQLSLYKLSPLARMIGGTPMGISARWGIRELPGLYLERQMVCDKKGSRRVWVVCSDRLSQLRSLQRGCELRREFGMGEQQIREAEQAMSCFQEQLRCSEEIVDCLSLDLDGRHFLRRQDALGAIDLWLAAHN